MDKKTRKLIQARLNEPKANPSAIQPEPIRARMIAKATPAPKPVKFEIPAPQQSADTPVGSHAFNRRRQKWTRSRVKPLAKKWAEIKATGDKEAMNIFRNHIPFKFSKIA